MKKVGFIGAGNMATAIIGGILKKGILKPQEMIASRRSADKLQALTQQYGIAVTTDNTEAAGAQIVVLAVKPQFLAGVLAEIADVVTDQTILVSLAAGKTMEWIANGLGRSAKIIRCMPNTPALVLEGCTGVCRNGLVTDEELEQVMTLLGSFGTASVVSENLMDAVVGVSGSSPAFVFMFIEALADGAVAAGMPRVQAYEFAARTVLGSAKLLLETGKHPGELKDMVCSPGGTTIEGVKTLEECGFRAAVMDAVEACVNKSRNL